MKNVLATKQLLSVIFTIVQKKSIIKTGDNMNKKIDLRVLKTKKNLYEALILLMKEKTFETIKVSDICDKALVNRSTFYSHFDDKYDLLNSLIADLKKNLKKELEKNSNISNSKEYYLEMIKIFLTHAEEKKEIYASIMINNKNGISMDMVYDALNEDITKRLENEKENNKLQVPSEIMAKFYLGAVFNLGMEWLTNKKYTKKEIVTYLDKLLPDDF